MTNLEIVQSFYQAAAKKDVAAALGLLAPDVVFRQTSALPWGGEYHGQFGIMQFFGELMARVDSTVEITEYIDAAESIVAIGYTRGTVKANGRPFEIRIAHLLTVREGKIAGFYPHIDTPGMLAVLNAE
jgi:ketosteroid isomerase-like protein